MHLTTFASMEYIKRFGTPTRENLGDHRFVGNRQYLSSSDFWRDWVDLTKEAQYIAGTDMNVTYATMIKSGLGLGLLGNYMNMDPYLVHVDLGVNIGHGIRMFSLEQKRNDRRSLQPISGSGAYSAATPGSSRRWSSPARSATTTSGYAG